MSLCFPQWEINLVPFWDSKVEVNHRLPVPLSKYLEEANQQRCKFNKLFRKLPELTHSQQEIATVITGAINLPFYNSQGRIHFFFESLGQTHYYTTSGNTFKVSITPHHFPVSSIILFCMRPLCTFSSLSNSIDTSIKTEHILFKIEKIFIISPCIHCENYTLASETHQITTVSRFGALVSNLDRPIMLELHQGFEFLLWFFIVIASHANYLLAYPTVSNKTGNLKIKAGITQWVRQHF